MYLSDLTFIDEGNPSKVDGNINYTKWRQAARVIQKIRKNQRAVYNFKPVDLLQKYLLKVNQRYIADIVSYTCITHITVRLVLLLVMKKLCMNYLLVAKLAEPPKAHLESSLLLWRT
jgi:hypothetical protein